MTTDNEKGQEPVRNEKTGALQTLILHETEMYYLRDDDGTLYHWDVSRGKELAQQHKEIILFAPRDFGITVEEVKRRYEGISEAHALTRDITQPLLFIPFQGQTHLIDGWHRLLKALLTGVETLPAYLLTQDEADSVLVAKIEPPRTRKGR